MAPNQKNRPRRPGTVTIPRTTRSLHDEQSVSDNLMVQSLDRELHEERSRIDCTPHVNDEGSVWNGMITDPPSESLDRNLDPSLIDRCRKLMPPDAILFHPRRFGRALLRPR